MSSRQNGVNAPDEVIVEGHLWIRAHSRYLRCRLFGHRWGEWYECLRRGLQGSECSRCGDRRFRDENGLHGAYSYEEVGRNV